MKKTFKILIFLIFINGIAFSAGQTESSEVIKEKKCPRKVKVITKEIRTGLFEEVKDLKKNVIPSKTTIVSTSVSGVIKSIDVNEGDQVKIGDTILTFNTDKIETELKSMKEKAALWQGKLNSRKKMESSK